MRKLTFFMALLLALVFPASTTAFAAEANESTALPFEVSSEAVYLINLNTGVVVYEKNADKKMYPASTTKIMTAILAFESGYDLDTTTVTAKGYLYDEFYGLNVSTGDIRRGETLTLRQLLYAMMLQSANEGASIVSDFLADGSRDYFSEMMNNRAKELGCTGTNFVNPHGLFNANQYTTARDMALLARHAMELPGFMEIASTVSYHVGATNIHEDLTWITTNRMMMADSMYYYEPIKGIKTGTLEQSGSCFVSTASLGGYDYLCVVLGAPVDYDADGRIRRENGQAVNSAFADTKKLYQWAFDTFSVKTLMDKGTEVTEVKLHFAQDTDYMKLASAERFTALVPDEIESGSIVMKYEVPDYITAPVKKGDVIGTAHLFLMEEEIGTVPLVATQNVQRSTFAYARAMGELVLLSFWFKFGLIFILVFAGLYIALMLTRNRNSRRYRLSKDARGGRPRGPRP